MRITFELSDDDLKHFRLIMAEARQVAARTPPEDIVAAAEKLLADANADAAPGFVADRLRRLHTLIAMLSDLDWRLPHQDAKRVLNALAYFTEPEDLIPDHIPVLGFLDDAIMIELVVRELKHEIEAYDDFCDYRERMRTEKGRRAEVNREEWLENRRKELQSRMRRRRKRSFKSPFTR